LAKPYDVEINVLVQVVRRSIERFSEGFMFQLNPKEFTNLQSQFVISSLGGMERTQQRLATTSSPQGPSSVVRVKDKLKGLRWRSPHGK